MERLADREILKRAGQLLARSDLMRFGDAEAVFSEARCASIASDGSTRRFWRVIRGDHPGCVIAAPGGTSREDLAESRAAWMIGRHLFRKGVSVPELYGWDPDTGILLFEDLGDNRLHGLIAQSRRKSCGQEYHEKMIRYYQDVLDNLVVMQCRGADGFDSAWCWDTPRYDAALMIERESGYFLRAFWQGIMQQDVPAGVEEELQQIARVAGGIPADFFLHRDFQSRNIMVKEEKVRIIDFQGGRCGPLAYDLASLLIDPYSNLTQNVQDRLFDFYLDTLSKHLTVDTYAFKHQFDLLAFQRNVQIIGAFSYLFAVRGKTFFKAFIQPALQLLEQRMRNPVFDDYPRFKHMVHRAVRQCGIH